MFVSISQEYESLRLFDTQVVNSCYSLMRIINHQVKIQIKMKYFSLPLYIHQPFLIGDTKTYTQLEVGINKILFHHNFCLACFNVMFKQNYKTEERCVPWFYPVEDRYLYEICDPWETTRFQTLLKEVSDDQCSECLPDCRRTKYKTSITAAPFKECDRTNLGISSLCSLNTDTAHMMINPPIWKNAIQGEYKKFNNGSLPTFIENQQGVFSNIRNYSSSDEELRNLVFRAQREKKLTYNALEEDITVVNFYFDESDVIQYTTFQRMTIIDFISSVRYKTCRNHFLFHVFIK